MMGEDGYQESADPAAAFERLRGEVSLLRHAVEGLTAARESIDIPNYEPTLARTEKVLAVLAQQIEGVRKSPAMTLTPENMGARLNASVMETANALRSHTQASKSAVDNTVNELRGLVRSARTGDEQNRWLYLFGGGGLVLGMLLWAALAGLVARTMPASWLWPERMAARTLDMEMWEGGQHMMASASPSAFGAVVAGDKIVTANRDALGACQRTAANEKKPVRCTIEVKAVGE
jgi:hypothetical protein